MQGPDGTLPVLIQRQAIQNLPRRNLDEEQQTEDYQMLSQLFDYQQLSETEEFGLKRWRNTLYKGTLIDRKRHGLGVLIYDNGRVYEGEWQDDHRGGRGFERFKTGASYLGQYHRNKPNGKGIYTW